MPRLIIFSPEIYPRVKVGGLGRAVFQWQEALRQAGWQLKVFTPRENIYSWPTTAVDQLFRRLGQAAVRFSQKKNWWPDLIWFHDWQPLAAVRYYYGWQQQQGRPAKIIWTVHSPLNFYLGGRGYEDNLQSYGNGGNDNSYGNPDGEIDWQDLFFDFQSHWQASYQLADLVTTVSRNYGHFLQQVFPGRKPIYAFPLGAGSNWQPKRSQHLKFKLGRSWPEFKRLNKTYLQRQFGLQTDAAPLFCFVSRLVPQKGVDLILKVLPDFLAKTRAQFLFLGQGLNRYQKRIRQLRRQFPQQLGFYLKANFSLPEQIFAGADFLVLPSRQEPFGLVVAEGQRYGVVPIVRAVDGLNDQLATAYHSFCFFSASAFQLKTVLWQAYQSWQQQYWPSHYQAVSRQAFRWDSAQKQWLAFLAAAPHI